MSDSNDHSSPLRTGYIVGVVCFALGMTVLQYLVAAAAYWYFFGTPSIRDITTVWVPEYSNSALWKGKVVFPARHVGGGYPPNTGVLMSFDPESGNSKEIKVDCAFPMAGLMVDGEQLALVGTNQLATFDGEQVQQFTPKRSLVRPCRPFLYEGRVAVIDMGTRGPPKLVVFQDGEWNELGVVVIPFDFEVKTVDGQDQFIRAATSSGAKAAAALSTIEVLSHDGRYHLFVSNGSHVVYRSQIELAPTTALLPANLETHVDLSRLDDWEIVCPAGSSVLMRGKSTWRAGLVQGEPLVVAVASSTSTNLFQSSPIFSFFRDDGSWKKAGEISTPSLAELLLVTDGLTTYFAPYSMMGAVVRIHRIADNKLIPTGAVIKAPQPEFVKIQLRAIQLSQWVYWPGLIIFILGLSYLMRGRGSPEYHFGVTTVELASFTRRGFGRLVDYFIYVGASYLVAHSFGMMSQEEVEKNVDKIWDFGPGGLMIRFMWMMLAIVLSYLLILTITSWFEGRWGLTLGKWIFGIRTRRSTLRPCGFLRAMLREILILVDTILALCCLPGSLCIALTANRQRIGDMLADTIVIRKPKPLEGGPRTA